MLFILNDVTSFNACLVVDVYSKWCGPCKAVTGLFRRIKNELGDDFLKFAIVRTFSVLLYIKSLRVG